MSQFVLFIYLFFCPLISHNKDIKTLHSAQFWHISAMAWLDVSKTGHISGCKRWSVISGSPGGEPWTKAEEKHSGKTTPQKKKKKKVGALCKGEVKDVAGNTG